MKVDILCCVRKAGRDGLHSTRGKQPRKEQCGKGLRGARSKLGCAAWGGCLPSLNSRVIPMEPPVNYAHDCASVHQDADRSVSTDQPWRLRRPDDSNWT